MSKITSCRRLRLPGTNVEEITGPSDSGEAGPTVEEACPAQRNDHGSGQPFHDGATGLQLNSKIVDFAIKEGLMFMH